MSRLADLNSEIREIDGALRRLDERQRTCSKDELLREEGTIAAAREELQRRVRPLRERKVRLDLGLTEDPHQPPALPDPQQLTAYQIQQIEAAIVGPAVAKAIGKLKTELKVRDNRIRRLDQLVELQTAEIHRLAHGARGKSMAGSSGFEVKFLDEGRRELAGVATSPRPDRMGDIIEPLGVSFTNPLPLLWQHDHSKPIGTVNFEKPTATGIKFAARIAKIDDEGPLRDRVEEAWLSVRTGLVTSVSVGFRPITRKPREGGGYVFTSVEVYELSLVTVPANPDAVVSQWRAMETVQ